MVSKVTAGSWWPGMWAINSAVGRFTPPSPLPLCLLLGWGEISLPIPHFQSSSIDADSIPLTPHHRAKKGDVEEPGQPHNPNTHGHAQANRHLCADVSGCQRVLPWAATNSTVTGSLWP
jgi:hypothetical protein